MHPIEFMMNSEYIELCNLLKLVGLADSGGRGKMMVAEGLVFVDGELELRKTAKIKAGQIVECEGQKVQIVHDASAPIIPTKIKPSGKPSPFDLKSANKSYASKKAFKQSLSKSKLNKSK